MDSVLAIDLLFKRIRIVCSISFLVGTSLISCMCIFQCISKVETPLHTCILCQAGCISLSRIFVTPLPYPVYSLISFSFWFSSSLLLSLYYNACVYHISRQTSRTSASGSSSTISITIILTSCTCAATFSLPFLGLRLPQHVNCVKVVRCYITHKQTTLLLIGCCTVCPSLFEKSLERT
jgi:hypothetical protein